MKKNIEQLLMEQLNYFQNLLDTVTEQKNLIARKDFLQLQKNDEKKLELITKIQGIDKLFEIVQHEDNRDFNIIQNLIKKINLILSKLILIEKENAAKLTELKLKLSGNHIEFYKKIIKP